MAVKYIDQIDLKDKRVICRVDYNVPYDDNMNITDDTRIKATIKTVDYCISNKAKIILISHLGRPKGKIVPEMSLAPVAERLSSLINKKVIFINLNKTYYLRKNSYIFRCYVDIITLIAVINIVIKLHFMSMICSDITLNT